MYTSTPNRAGDSAASTPSAVPSNNSSCSYETSPRTPNYCDLYVAHSRALVVLYRLRRIDCSLETKYVEEGEGGVRAGLEGWYWFVVERLRLDRSFSGIYR
jgi:hypothetical protein